MVVLLHPDLTLVETSGDGYKARWKHLLFVVSEAVESDGKIWRHTSVSRVDRTVPLYRDMMNMKRLTIGDDKYAYQIHPSKEDHIDIAGNRPRPVQVLHMWACLGTDALESAGVESAVCAVSTRNTICGCNFQEKLQL